MRKFFLPMALILGAIAPAAWAANISSCRTITEPGSYELSRNLQANGTCLFVSAKNVIIDLGGHLIRGNGTGKGVTDDGSNQAFQSSVTVRNGSISNFFAGVDLDGTANAVVENLTVHDNVALGIGVKNGRVESNVVFDNGNLGIEAGAESIVTGNTVEKSSQIGISTGAGSTVTHNVVSASGADGIAVREGSLVRGNTTSKSGRNGIAVLSCPALVTGNAFSANNAAHEANAGGITLLGSGCLVRNNVSF